MYHLIFIVKIKNNMRVCIIGDGLSSLTLAKALINENIYVDVFGPKKKIYQISLELLVFQRVMLNFLMRIF